MTKLVQNVLPFKAPPLWSLRYETALDPNVVNLQES